MWLHPHTDNAKDFPYFQHISATNIATYIWLDLNEHIWKLVQGQHDHGCDELLARLPYDGEFPASVDMWHLEPVLGNGGTLSVHKWTLPQYKAKYQEVSIEPRTFGNALTGNTRKLVTELCRMERSANEEKLRCGIAFKEKKAKLFKDFCQNENSAKEEQLKRSIDCISNDIDERIQVERRQHKAGGERVNKLNDLAFKGVSNQDSCPEEVKSRVCHNCNCKKARNSANVPIQDLEDTSRANAEDIARVLNVQKAFYFKKKLEDMLFNISPREAQIKLDLVLCHLQRYSKLSGMTKDSLKTLVEHFMHRFCEEYTHLVQGYSYFDIDEEDRVAPFGDFSTFKPKEDRASLFETWVTDILLNCSAEEKKMKLVLICRNPGLYMNVSGMNCAELEVVVRKLTFQFCKEHEITEASMSSM